MFDYDALEQTYLHPEQRDEMFKHIIQRLDAEMWKAFCYSALGIGMILLFLSFFL